MNKKQCKQGLARVWPALGAVAMMAAGLTGGAGANVWVQDGALWIYLAHNGAYDESGALLKLGALCLNRRLEIP